jgi:hypothetical protein
MASRLGLAALLAALVVASGQEKEKPGGGDDQAKAMAKEEQERSARVKAAEERWAAGADGLIFPVEVPALLATNPTLPFPAGVPWVGLGPLVPLKLRYLLREPPEGVPVSRLVEALGSENALVRKHLLRLLRRLADDPKRHDEVSLDALPALLVLSRDTKEQKELREAAGRLVYESYSDEEQAAAFTRGASGESKPERRSACCRELGILFVESEELDDSNKKRITDALESALLDRDPDVQAEAAKALEQIEQRKKGVDLDAVKPFRLRVKAALEKRVSRADVEKVLRAAKEVKVEVNKDGTITVTGKVKVVQELLQTGQVTAGSQRLPLRDVLDDVESEKEPEGKK